MLGGGGGGTFLDRRKNDTRCLVVFRSANRPFIPSDFRFFWFQLFSQLHLTEAKGLLSRKDQGPNTAEPNSHINSAAMQAS